MCLIVFAWEHHPRYRLVLAANRDEFFSRPTKPVHFWEDAPAVLAGRDLQAGGTWLGVSTTGRLAVVTNFREPHPAHPEHHSRGELVSAFLTSSLAPAAYLASLGDAGHRYGGFNLLVGDCRGLHYLSNRDLGPLAVPPGIHGLSNHLLNTPWPKVVAATEQLAGLLAREQVDQEELFAMLSDPTRFSDELLPATGVSLEWERALSARFISGEFYGTRSTSLLLLDRQNSLTYWERRFDNKGQSVGTDCFTLQLA